MFINWIEKINCMQSSGFYSEGLRRELKAKEGRLGDLIDSCKGKVLRIIGSEDHLEIHLESAIIDFPTKYAAPVRCGDEVTARYIAARFLDDGRPETTSCGFAVGPSRKKLYMRKQFRSFEKVEIFYLMIGDEASYSEKINENEVVDIID